ncbi:MAG TPA: 4-alpha-glucanotransferase [Alphaproteobacteria bacterium]|jgi:4-alpha-glucanotransferase
MADQLAELAAAVGLADRWTDFAGQSREVAPVTLRHLLTTLGFPCDRPADLTESLRRIETMRADAASRFATAVVGHATALAATGFVPGKAQLIHEDGALRDLRLVAGPDGRTRLPAIREPGYYRLEQNARSMTVAVAPKRAYGIADAAPGRTKLWGVAAQLYSLHGPLAFGDFADLADLADLFAAQGADALAISPVHALFPGTPSRYSPYSPATRLFLNVAYAAPSLVLRPEIVGPMPRETVDGGLIDWPRAVPEKLAWLAEIHARFLAQAHGELRDDLAAFRQAGGQALERHALFETLQMHFADRGSGWQAWPAEFHAPDDEAVARFAEAHGIAIEFHVFLQWLAERGLAQAQERAKRGGMAIGLVADLAIGMDPGGSHAWSRPEELLMGLGVGAPPDLINGDGQDWGLTALSPFALAASGYAPFIATLRAALRHAGGVRIDHVLGLARLWLVPQGAGATHGAYLRFPLEDLMRIIALESHRYRAIVVGEDLGTVPDGFRKTLRDGGLLGMNVLWFERDRRGRFIAPDKWPAHRLALTSTHDLPTVAGWWRGRDCDWQDDLNGRAADARSAPRRARGKDRGKLWDAFVAADCAKGPLPAAADPQPAVDAAAAFVAKTACTLAVLPLEDLLGRDEQPNIPGTIDKHPNWRRRLPDLAEALGEPSVAGRLETLRRERPRS